MRRRHGLITLAALALPAWADDAKDYWTAITYDQDWHLARLVARTGLDPNTPSADGEPPLVGALRQDADKVAAWLIANPRVDVEARNAAGETPLMLAAIRTKLPLLKQLLARGAKVNQDGWTALHYACSQIELAPAQILLDAGADANARSPNGTTPLMMAARYGGLDQLTLLLARGANPRLRNARGLSVADFARDAGRMDDIVERLAKLAGPA
ncbi:MAG: ankyrin repeat domain-containing protein [Proteobacteria bacterium]|nr:ankyrin repeat domain-containing protein [Pseudomonadota bacterium]